MRKDIKDTIDNYVEKGFPPGGFVESVLANDLKRAIAIADISTTINSLKEIVGYVNAYIPSNVHGSYEAVDRHLDKFKERED